MFHQQLTPSSHPWPAARGPNHLCFPSATTAILAKAAGYSLFFIGLFCVFLQPLYYKL